MGMKGLTGRWQRQSDLVKTLSTIYTDTVAVNSVSCNLDKLCIYYCVWEDPTYMNHGMKNKIGSAGNAA